jgi:hypothetical protein
MLFSNNPIDEIKTLAHNTTEGLSRLFWLIGKKKKVQCTICGDVLDSRKDMYSPMQCGWGRIDHYTWICHRCLQHRDFTPYIEQIDEDERRLWEGNRKECLEEAK